MKKVWLYDFSRNGFDRQPLIDRGISIEMSENDPDGILVAAGDGGMFHAVNIVRSGSPDALRKNTPFYGIHCGTVGFLMNHPTAENFDDLAAGRLDLIEMRMLRAVITYADGKRETAYAFNDFYMERSARPQAKIRVSVNGDIVFDPLMGDGIIVASPPGSSSYNFKAGGPILALESRDMVITGICSSGTYGWKTTGLHELDRVTLEPLETNFRPVRFCGDDKEYLNVSQAVIGYSDVPVTLAFAWSQKFRERRRDFQFGKTVI